MAPPLSRHSEEVKQVPFLALESWLRQGSLGKLTMEKRDKILPSLNASISFFAAVQQQSVQQSARNPTKMFFMISRYDKVWWGWVRWRGPFLVNRWGVNCASSEGTPMWKPIKLFTSSYPGTTVFFSCTNRMLTTLILPQLSGKLGMGPPFKKAILLRLGPFVNSRSYHEGLKLNIIIS